MERYPALTPHQALHYAAGPQSDEYATYTLEFNRHVESINATVGEELALGRAGVRAFVPIPLPGVTQKMLLGLVLHYRAAGWGVTYEEGRRKAPCIEIGIENV